MAEEYRDSVYWGSGQAGKWFKTAIGRHTKTDPRFKGSLMNFVRYAVEYCLTHDKSLSSQRQKPKA